MKLKETPFNAKRLIVKSFHRSVDIVNSVNTKIVENELIRRKDRVLLSVSGGQDSLCLLVLLNQLAAQLELHLGLFWCHHLWQIDSFSLMRQIAKLSFLFQFNTCFTISAHFLPSELLARNWRHNCSYRVCFFYNYYKIGLAHSANDKIETVFLNLARGTGLTGLASLGWSQKKFQETLFKGEHTSRISVQQVSSFFWFSFYVPKKNKKRKNLWIKYTQPDKKKVVDWILKGNVNQQRSNFDLVLLEYIRASVTRAPFTFYFVNCKSLFLFPFGFVIFPMITAMSNARGNSSSKTFGLTPSRLCTRYDTIDVPFLVVNNLLVKTTTWLLCTPYLFTRELGKEFFLSSKLEGFLSWRATGRQIFVLPTQKSAETESFLGVRFCQTISISFKKKKGGTILKKKKRNQVNKWFCYASYAFLKACSTSL